MNYKWLMLVVALGTLSACVMPQVYNTSQERVISLKAGDLSTYGLAFITPSSVTGQEEEKQGVAFTFAEVMKKERAAIRCLTLPETLTAINQAGLSEDYKRMYAEYRDTGIFSRDILKKVGEATKTRYVAQIKLMSFSQGQDGRFSAFGLRLVDTRYANLRLFFQIWNTADGSIAWEGAQEIRYARDTMTEASVTQKTIAEIAARDIIAKLP
ncbi:MAG: hypothetical protein ACXWMJ_09260 [Syntrophales bacterium]